MTEFAVQWRGREQSFHASNADDARAQHHALYGEVADGLRVLPIIEIVEVYTWAGRVSVNFTRSCEEGFIDGDEPETTGEVMRAVARACERGETLIDTEGKPVVIYQRSIGALAYKRVKGKEQ